MRGLLWKCADLPRSPTMLSHNLKISLEIKGFSGIKSQRAVPAFPWTLYNETECLNLSTYLMCYVMLVPHNSEMCFCFHLTTKKNETRDTCVPYLTHPNKDRCSISRQKPNSRQQSYPHNCPTLPSGKGSIYGVLLCFSDVQPCFRFLSLRRTPRSRPHCQGFQCFLQWQNRAYDAHRDSPNIKSD